MEEVVRINLNEEAQEGRFSRFGLIPWWDQKKLANANILVVGAGALGNEIVKNLALLGAGNVMVVDMDLVENSNLSRSVLFRERDNGRPKAVVAAEAAQRIFPQMKVRPFTGNAVYDLGLGVYRWADIVLAGLDNREARLSVNQNCYRVNRPWVDGAIEKLAGVARMFEPPDGACYECTMNERDWQLLEMRRSCNLLSREDMQEGKVPTTPTVASVIAAMQVQEAVKYLHGLPTLAGKGYVFNGVEQDNYIVEYVRKEQCFSHETYTPIVELPGGVSDMGPKDLFDEARADLGPDVVVELNRDIARSFRCRECGREEDVFRSLGKVRESEAACPHCGQTREVLTTHTIAPGVDVADHTFEELGVPPLDIVGVRAGMQQVFYEFRGDAQRVLGPLWGGQ
ncbi:MAG: ThiF family adenylyltransferase [Candidatus Brocadiia bacterium]